MRVKFLIILLQHFFFVCNFQGGFRLQILDHLERPVLDLTPSIGGSEFLKTDAT